MGVMASFRQRVARAIAGKSFLMPPNESGSWTRILDTFPGAWQQNQEPVDRDTILSFHAVFACVTLIASDIAKLRFKLLKRADSGIWRETESPAFSPVLRKPNQYQNQIQFREYWMMSKLASGNVYLLKERDSRGVVVRLQILNPEYVQPLVSTDGEVFYRLKRDQLPAIEEEVIVPAREIIHDRMNCIGHPLVGVSPLSACAMAAQQGMAIQRNQSKFFGNNSMPSGILTTPGNISSDAAANIREAWQRNYGGDNYGRVAVLGNDLKFQPMVMTATDAQLIEQLKLTAEIVCSVFHVPMYMVDLGPPPPYNNEDKYLGYYSRALQIHIESMEASLDDGLGLDGRSMGVELDTKALLRMDTATRYKAASDAIGGGWMSPNEARISEDLEPVEGGDSPYLQQQNYSLAALAKRDADDPFAAPAPAHVVVAEDEAEESETEEDIEERAMLAALMLEKELRDAQYA